MRFIYKKYIFKILFIEIPNLKMLIDLNSWYVFFHISFVHLVTNPKEHVQYQCMYIPLNKVEQQINKVICVIDKLDQIMDEHPIGN
jgi:hypothetical protein